jgi:hypothetical protein
MKAGLVALCLMACACAAPSSAPLTQILYTTWTSWDGSSRVALDFESRRITLAESPRAVNPSRQPARPMAVVASRRLTVAEMDSIESLARAVLRDGAVAAPECRLSADFSATFEIRQQDGSRFTESARCRTEAASRLSRGLICGARPRLEECARSSAEDRRRP